MYETCGLSLHLRLYKWLGWETRHLERFVGVGVAGAAAAIARGGGAAAVAVVVVAAAAAVAVAAGGGAALVAVAAGKIFRDDALQRVLPAACGVELAHAASLVLDDSAEHG